MSKAARFAFAVFALLSCPVFAAFFIVPEDHELVEKSGGIIVGVVTGSTSALRDDGDVETIYDVRIERAMKGAFARGSVVQVASLGGNVDKRWTLVPGSAHFQKDDRVVLFLVRHEGRWVTTDMTLGKFRFVTSTGGQSLLLRDEEDIVGFDRQMRTHVEKIRREAEFLAFIEKTVRGREAEVNYFVAPGEVVSLPESEKSRISAENDTFTARSYAVHFNSGQYPGRWPESRMSPTTARPFFKNSAQNASGLGDGGVQMITNALNAWSSDCPSYVNIPYGGTNGLLKNSDDNVNTVVWNDPGSHIAGNWTGSGVIARAYTSGDNLHTFEGLTDGWVSFSDTDVVVQNGLTGAESFMATAMTHEIGHAVALRHSNTHFDGTACQTGDECTTAAIMNASVSTHWNSTLQPWDQNGIRALYPAACGAPPAAPLGVAAFTTVGSSVTVQWTASVGATSYKVFRRASVAAAYTEIASGVLASPYVDNTVVSGTSYQYVVRATNATGDSGDSAADFTTAITFTDGPLVLAGITAVKLAHFTELATAINALRTLAGLGAFTFTQGAPALGGTIKASHVADMQVALNEAYIAIGAGALNFDPLGSSILALHMNTLRTLTR